MTEAKATILIVLGSVLALGSVVGGCTYTVTENNRQYYETMKNCIERGSTFVPTRGEASSAACIAR